MSIRLNMWNFHDFCERHQIPHNYSIHGAEAKIQKITLFSTSIPEEGTAVILNSPEDSEYSCMLSYKGDHLYFLSHTAIDVMNQINDLYRVLTEWERKLQQINLSHGTLTSLIQTFNELFLFPITIHHGDTLLACSEGFGDLAMKCWNTLQHYTIQEMHQLLPITSQEYLHYTAEKPVIFSSPLHEGRQILFTNLTPPQHHTIRITAYSYEKEFTPGHAALMEFFMQIISRNLTIRASFSNRKILQPEAFFLHFLNTDEWNFTQEEAVLRQLHWNKESLFTVFRIELKSENTSVLLDSLYRTVRDTCPDSVCILHRKAVFLFCNSSFSPEGSIAEKLMQVLPEESYVMGQSNYSVSFHSIPELCIQAEKALQQARLHELFFLSSANNIARYLEQRFYEDRQLQSLIHPAISQLLISDKELHTELLKTLMLYLQSGQNITATAHNLGIHRNTLQNRLDRIRHITGLNLHDPKIQEALHLSILLIKPV